MYPWNVVVRVALGRMMETPRYVIGYGLPALGLFILIDEVDGYGWAVAVLFVIALSWVTHWYNHRLVLIHRPRQIVQEEDSLYQVVAEQADLAGLPMPKVYEKQTESLNAYATGRSPQHAVVIVTSGLRHALDYYELRAAVAHELAHVWHRDGLSITATVTIVGIVQAVSILVGLHGWIGAFAFLLPVVSCAQEFRADSTATSNCGDAPALARTLRKLFDVGLFTFLFLFPFHSHPPTRARIWHLKRLA